MELLEQFEKLKVLIVGDVMLDRYWWGSVTRISPEAPVPVVRLKRTTMAPGGAANVAVNVRGLGANAVLVGIIGEDSEADLFPTLLEGSGVSAEHLLRVPGRATTIKTRVVAHSQQVVRVDQEDSDPIDGETEERLCEHVKELIPRVDAVAISDYAKGMLTDQVLDDVFRLAGDGGKPVLVDPKGKDYRKYRGATLLTPNRREAAEACNLYDNRGAVDTAGAMLMSDLDLNALLITQGEEGMTLFRKTLDPVHLTAVAREVYDVTGAGDTVIATLATAIGAGADLLDAAHLANVAAGLVVEQVGTTSVTTAELRAAISLNGDNHAKP